MNFFESAKCQPFKILVMVARIKWSIQTKAVKINDVFKFSSKTAVDRLKSNKLKG